MKRLLFLAAFVLLACATVARAEIVSVAIDSRTTVGSYDKVVLKITGLVSQATDPYPVPDGYFISTIVGTWTTNGEGTIHTTGTTSNWSTRMLNDENGQDEDSPDNFPTQSWVNMANKGTTPTASYTGTFPNLATFTENFYMDTDVQAQYALGPVDYWPNNEFDNTLLAVFYVTPGTFHAGDTIWSGTCSYLTFGGDGASTNPISTTFVIVPEPSTLALLGCGLFGLLAYAWRKRK